MPRTARRLLAAAVLVAALALAVLIVRQSTGSSRALRAATVAAMGEASCADASVATVAVNPAHDVAYRGAVLLGARDWVIAGTRDVQHETFKVPMTLPKGAEATLSVPVALRGRVGIVFSAGAHRRVLSGGVPGADTSVHFSACPPDGAPGRIGWPGGFVVDKPRCASIVLQVAAATAVRRVALGRRC